MIYEVTPYTALWPDGIPASYLGERRFIDAPTSGDAARIAAKRWPDAWRIVTRPARKEDSAA